MEKKGREEGREGGREERGKKGRKERRKEGHTRPSAGRWQKTEALVMSIRGNEGGNS